MNFRFYIYILYIIALFAANIVPTTSVPNPESTPSQMIPTIRFTGMPRWDLLTQISYEGSLKRIFPQQTSETFHVTGASPAKEHKHTLSLRTSTCYFQRLQPEKYVRQIEYIFPWFAPRTKIQEYIFCSIQKATSICANTLSFSNRTKCFNINRSPMTQNGRRIPQKSCKHASFEPWDFQFSNCNWYKLFVNIGEETGIGPCNLQTNI